MSSKEDVAGDFTAIAYDPTTNSFKVIPLGHFDDAIAARNAALGDPSLVSLELRAIVPDEDVEDSVRELGGRVSNVPRKPGSFS